MQNLNLKQLEVFAAVVEQGSFTAAAEQLYLAQSTVSGHITALEKELGVTLLLRTGKRKIALTEEGRKVYACPSLEEIRASCAHQVSALWDEVKRFEYPHRYYVDLSKKLWEERQNLLRTLSAQR